MIRSLLLNNNRIKLASKDDVLTFSLYIGLFNIIYIIYF